MALSNILKETTIGLVIVGGFVITTIVAYNFLVEWLGPASDTDKAILLGIGAALISEGLVALLFLSRFIGQSIIAAWNL